MELTWLDRALQSWRISKAARYLRPDDRVLDVGCADGALFRRLSWVRNGLGIDPEATPSTVGSSEIRKGAFPIDLAGDGDFDAVTLLAVFEHVPGPEQGPFVDACRGLLRSGGRVVMTVPSPIVDHLIEVFQALHLLAGMETDEHWGFHPSETVPLFESRGFTTVRHRRFQLGLNHLFVFELP